MATPGVTMVGVRDTSPCVTALHATVAAIMVNQVHQVRFLFSIYNNFDCKSAFWAFNAVEPH